MSSVNSIAEKSHTIGPDSVKMGLLKPGSGSVTDRIKEHTQQMSAIYSNEGASVSSVTVKTQMIGPDSIKMGLMNQGSAGATAVTNHIKEQVQAVPEVQVA